MDGSQAFPKSSIERPDGHDPGVKDSPGTSLAGFNAWVHDVLDWIVKLLPVIATIAVTILADGYKTSLTASTLLSEREKADSQLRSQMFATLVDPISGSKSGEIVPLERQRLLAELLSINFHEHIGLKPLLTHVDAKLAIESNDSDAAKARAAKESRNSFHQIARTVISRQTAMLARSSGDTAGESGAKIQKLDIGAPDPGKGFAEYKRSSGDHNQLRVFGELIETEGPTKNEYLLISVSNPNWENESFRISVGIYSRNSSDPEPLARHEFDVSWFDFPLTDHTLLADGTRFALVLDEVYDLNDKIFVGEKIMPNATNSTRRVKMNIIWFPKDFIAAHERPTNHRQFLKNIGINR